MHKNTRLSLIIPCYNEEEIIPHIVKDLNHAVAGLKRKYDVELIFVDDGSTDHTEELLNKYYGKKKDVIIARHEKNKNLGAALKTGFKIASGDIIAVLDSDLTYPPQLLMQMLKMLDEKTDIVTVSPYHPEGKIKGASKERVFLSKAVSMIYRILVSPEIYTYSAMVRVYKKKVLNDVKCKSDDFLINSEIMVRALLSGYHVRELPTTLRTREYGSSKMRIIKETINNFGFVLKIIEYRLFGMKI